MKALALTIFGLFIATAVLVMSPTADGRIAVVIGDHQDPAQFAASAGAVLIAMLPSKRVVIVQSDSSGLLGRIYSAGAIFAFNPLAAVGCSWN